MPPAAPANAELLGRALGGDGRAWNELVDRFGGLVFATARRCGLSREESEDVAQTVFANLVRSLARVRDAERLPAWLITTTKREAWRVARSRSPQAGALELDATASGTIEAEADAHERRLTVHAALAQLDSRCSDLLRALFLGAADADYTEIGLRFGIAENSVGPIRNRCLRRLLAALEELGFEPTEHGFADSSCSATCTKSRNHDS